MSYRDRLHDCKLGDVFLVHRSSRWKFGRSHRVVSYPYQDVTDGEAMGRPPEELSESVEVIGDDFDLAVKRIRFLLDSPDPIVYVHPIWGPMRVRATEQTTASYGNTGINGAAIDLAITRVEDEVPVAVVVPAKQVTLAADNVRYVVTRQFDKDFKSKKLGFSDLVNAVRNGIGDGVMALAKVNNTIASKLGALTSITQDIGALQRQAQTLINTPSALASAVLGLAAQGRSIFETVIYAPTSVYDQAIGIASIASRQFGGKVVPGQSASESGTANPQRQSSTHAAITLEAIQSTATHKQNRAGLPVEAERTRNREVEAQCYDALEALIMAGATATYCEMATAVQWSSRREAAAFRKSALAALRTVRDSPLIDAETARAMTILMAEMDAYLESVAQQAVQTDDYMIGAPRSAVLVAWDLYGDVTLAYDIVRRNPSIAVDPGRIPELSVLEVSRANA